MQLLNRDVFVSRRVENHVRLNPAENAPDSAFVAHIRECAGKGYETESSLTFQIDLKEVILAEIEQRD
jgi:hypothetical protein